jgi:hypothetical protein
MARSDLLVSLVRAGAAGDREMLRSTAEALVAEERAQNHHIVADRLERALSAVPITPPALTSTNGLAGAGKDAILEVEPRTQMSQLLLSERTCCAPMVTNRVIASFFPVHLEMEKHRSPKPWLNPLACRFSWCAMTH